MMYNLFVDVIFRLINFGVLIAVAMYVYKKYILASVENTMAEEEAYHNGLKQQLGALESRADEIIHEKVLLEKRGALLKNKVDLWRAEFDKAAQEREIEKQQLLAQAIIRVQKQSLNVAQATLLTKAIPIALANARAQLEKSTAHNQSADYLQTLIEGLQRETHGK